MIKKESLPNLAGPTQILPVNVRGPALILKTVITYFEDCYHDNFGDSGGAIGCRYDNLQCVQL